MSTKGLLRAAFRTGRRFLFCVAFLAREGKQLFTVPAFADFEIGNALRVDFRGKEQLEGVVADRQTVGKLDDSKSIIEHFKGGFLASPFEEMAHDENRLSFPLGAEVAQRALPGGGAGKLPAGAGSYRRHRNRSNKVIMNSMYHRGKNGVKVRLPHTQGVTACPM